MNPLELFLIAIGLSMDAFAVSVSKGLSMKTHSLRNCMIVGLWFGAFQALMPLVGYWIGSAFESYITAVDHWIAFVLLAIIGINMIKESFNEEEEEGNDSLKVSIMFTLAVATSIDAFAVGITFALLPSVNIIYAVIFIGVITMLLSAIGVKMEIYLGKDNLLEQNESEGSSWSV
ncbi:MAG: putative rane protein, partial [Evtepia sp.]|nr:putative rane protein [Evtepia sp.]